MRTTEAPGWKCRSRNARSVTKHCGVNEDLSRPHWCSASIISNLSLTAGTRLGVYEVTAPIGEGGMGQVFRATDTKLKRQVAIKILPPSLAADHDRLARFQREAEVLASLNHPHIAAIYGLEENGGITALVMELVDGDDLSQRIARGAIPLDEALPIARQIADAVAAAHERGIVHRDLKPANIKLSSDGVVKLLDFGLAKALDHAAPFGSQGSGAENAPTLTTPAVTQAGVLLGTAAYMSPEQARGTAVDKRADVWAFGCVLFEMLTGKRAFPGDTVSDTLAGVLRGDPDWSQLPRDLPSPIVRVLKRCLEKDRRRRLGDLHDAALDLEESSISTSPAENVSTSAKVRRGSWGLLTIATLVGGLAAGAGLARALLGSRDAPQPTFMTISLPAGFELPLGGSPASMAFSLDGRALFFGASHGMTPLEIYRASLDGFGIQAISGSSGLEVPTVSADGRSLIALRGDQVIRLPAAGGTPTPIPGTTASRVTVMADGRLALATAGIIRVVPEIGGSAVLVSKLPLAQAAPLTTEWLLAAKVGTDEIVAVKITDGTVSTLTAGRSPRYVSSGHLVFYRDGALWAARMKPPNRIVGEPVLMVGGVATVGGFAPTALYTVAEAGHLAFVPTPPAATRRIVWVSRSGVVGPAFAETSDFDMPRMSPDGTRVALTERDGISMVDLERGTRMRLGTEVLKRRPVWRPDGKTLTFQSQSDIYEQPADGSVKPAPLVVAPDSQFPDGWSPDGKTLVYNQGSATRDLFVLHDGKNEMLLATGAHERGGVFHPGGNWLAYASDDSGRDEVYILRWPAGGGKIPVSTRGGRNPMWSRDGSEIFYREENRMMAVRFDHATGRLAAPQFLFDASRFRADLNVPEFDVSPDGRFVMIEEDTGKRADEIRVILNWSEELKRKLP